MTGDRLLDLLVVGDANPDIVLSGVPQVIAYAQVEQLVETGTLTVGGSAAILACGAARLGLRTALASVVGDDGAGRFMLDQLRRRDVGVSGVRIGEGLATGLTVHLVKDEQAGRAMLTFPGCITALDDQMIPAGAAALGAARPRELVLPAAAAGRWAARPLRGRARGRRYHLARHQLGPGRSLGGAGRGAARHRPAAAQRGGGAGHRPRARPA